jgi:membrane protein
MCHGDVVGRTRDAQERARRRWENEIDARPRLGGWIGTARAFLHDAREDRVTGLAAEVAFYAILSLFPAVVALAATLGFLESLLGVDAAARVEDALVGVIDDLLGDGSGNLDTAVSDLFDETSLGLLGLGLAVTVYTTSRAFNGLINALDVVYDIVDTRSSVRRRLLAFGLAVGSVVVAAIVLTMVVIGPAFGGAQELADHFGWGDAFVDAWRFLRVPLVIAALTLWASVMFHIAPNHSTPWRADLPGAVVTMLLWLVGAVGFRAYLVVASGGANAVFGVLGGALTLLLWLYVMGLALLVGGEVNAHLEQSRAEPPAPDPPPSLAP